MQVAAAAVVVRWMAILEAEAKCKAEAEWQAEEVELEHDGRSLVKQKGWVEGEQLACDMRVWVQAK